MTGAVNAPHDDQAEAVALGSMLLHAEGAAHLVETLKSSDFYKPAHQLIFEAASAVFTRGEPVDLWTVGAEMDRQGTTERAGGRLYLSDVVASTPSWRNGGFYAAIVAEKSALRRLAETCETIYHRARGPVQDVEGLLAYAQDAMYAASPAAKSDSLAPVGDQVPVVVEQLGQGPDAPGATGLPTGFADLDELTGGLRPGQLWIVAARPSVGKSTLALDFARNVSVHHKLPSAFFSLEMGKRDLVLKLMAAECRVPFANLRNAKLTESDWDRLRRRVPQLDAPLHIDDTPGITVGAIRAKARRMQAQVGLSMLVVDYLQLIGGSGKAENRQQDVAEISRSLKLTAQELDVPVVALSQLNRVAETRADKKPAMHDLRESGAIEQDADGIILLFRPDMADPESGRAGEADLIVEKNRSGSRGTVTVAFQGHYSRFADMATDDNWTPHAAAERSAA